MADGLGFKTFTTGEVLTAGDTNGYLMQGILVFATEAARDAAITVPAEGQFAFTKDTNSTWYYDGAAWVASGAGGGKIAQVVTASTTTATNIASTSYADTTLTATITPTSASSKIYIMATQLGRLYILAAEIQGSFRILKGASEIVAFDYAFNLQTSGTTTAPGAIIPLQFVDSPATTSATTYKVQAKVHNTANSGQYQAQYGEGKSIITLMEVLA